MTNLRWNELFKALFLAGFFGYLAIALTGIILIGILVLLIFAWLCYDFRGKVIIFRQIAWREIRDDVKNSAKKTAELLADKWKDERKLFWDDNHVKICSFILAIATAICIAWIPSIVAEGRPITGYVVLMFLFGVLGFLFIRILSIFSSDPDLKLTDKKIAKFFVVYLLIFFIWKLPKFIIKTTTLAVKTVHSKELVATAVYSLAGMIYIILFPPFALAPAEIFLMAIGCGLFTGIAGMAVHRVLLTTTTQTFFAKVEAW